MSPRGAATAEAAIASPIRRLKVGTSRIVALVGSALNRRGAVKAHAGTAAVEFALVAPMLLLLVLGMCQFGITLNQYLTLTNAVRSGARQLSMSRGDATPHTDTINQIYGSAPNLTKASLTITTSVNGTACGNDATCKTALIAAGPPATVTASYPCSLAFFGYNFAAVCILSSQTTERVE
jgi:Flp pilus assembly protein TadG